MTYYPYNMYAPIKVYSTTITLDPRDPNTEKKKLSDFYDEVAEFTKKRNISNANAREQVADKILNSFKECALMHDIRLDDYIKGCMISIKNTQKCMNYKENSRKISNMVTTKIKYLQKNKLREINTEIDDRVKNVISILESQIISHINVCKTLFQLGYVNGSWVQKRLIPHEGEVATMLGIAKWRADPSFRPDVASKQIARHILKVTGVPETQELICDRIGIGR